VLTPESLYFLSGFCQTDLVTRSFILLTSLFILVCGWPLKATPAPAKSGAAAEKAENRPANRKSGTRVLTKAVGEVAHHVVTSREVKINDAIEKALEAKVSGSPIGKLQILDDRAKGFPSEVNKVLDEWVIYLEAKSLSAQPSTRIDVTTAVQTVNEVWAQNPAWRQLEVAPEELREMVERKLIAKDFERLKSDPQLAPVTDEDALAYYRRNRLKFGSLPFSAFKDNIKAFLIKQQTERRLSEWREVLRRKYKVRNFIAG